jgi:hypothetical protein
MKIGTSVERGDRYRGVGDGEGSKAVSAVSCLRAVGVQYGIREGEVNTERFGWVRYGGRRRMVGEGPSQASRTCSITTRGEVDSTISVTAWEASDVESRLVRGDPSIGRSDEEVMEGDEHAAGRSPAVSGPDAR